MSGKKAVFILVGIFIHSLLQAQFGNLQKLKEKAGGIISEKLIEQTENKRSEYDTASFNYAIAFLDKAESYENKQKGEELIKASNFLLTREEEKTDLEEARDLYDFGRVNYNNRNFRLAEIYLLAAILEYESLNAKDNPNYLKSLGVLGQLYSVMARFELAETFTKKALDGWASVAGESSPGYAAEFNNLAVLRFNKGEYGQAEKDISKAIDLIRKTEGPHSMPYAISLNNQGILYQYLGRTETSLANLSNSLDIAGEILREKSGTYLQLMTNKALVLQENKRYEEAEATYKEAIALQTSRLKLNRKSDPDYAHMLNNLASLYLITNRADEAEKLLTESLEIYTSKFGESHPTVASAQADLGNFYRSQNNLSEAENYLIKAITTRRNTLGETHPHTVQSQEDLAVVYWLKGDIEQAEISFDQVMNYSLDFINSFFAPMSEVEKTKYWDKLKPRFLTYYNFAFSQPGRKKLLEKALNYRLATKGLLMNASTKIKNTILSSEDQELIDLYTRWQDQKQTLAVYYSLSKEEIASQRINVDSLELAANQTERLLSEKSTSFTASFVNKETDYKKITQKLQANDVIIEVIQYPFYQNRLTSRVAYAFILIWPDLSSPEVVLIENGELLDTRYYKYYNNVIKNKLTDDYSYSEFWAPVQNRLGSASRIYLSPDGIYNQINIATLKQPSGRYLIEDNEIHVIGNPTDLLEAGKPSVPGKTAFLVGNPLYGSADIAPLPGTQKEVDQIVTTLKNNQYQVTGVSKGEATESAVKKVSSPNLLHIATHGYFLEDTPSGGQVFGIQVEYARGNPLLRSGLLLAGASTGNETSQASFDQDNNGVLTAYEAINLPLSKTQMIVLSACETGKGDVISGEGVYGLQRAFMIAGASQLVMSLWKVDDAATQQLMSLFYHYWIGKKMTSNQAFRAAQLELMKTFKEPYYWGAFVMVD